MRSSLRFLAASRSGGNGEWVPDESKAEAEDKSISIRRSEHPGGGDGADVTIRVKVGFKTILLVVVIFDLVHLSIREILDFTFIENLLGAR